MRQLSSQDAAFIYGETPAWHMHVAALGIADPTLAPESANGDVLDRARTLVLERLPEMPQFRWRLVDTPFGVDRPHWVEDPDLDPDYHIRRVTVPAPGGDAELDALVGELVASKLDRHRPLWEIYLIDGLQDGRVAMLTKMHHSLVDGISGAGLMQIMLDITPDPRPPSLETEQPLGTESPPSLQRFVRGVASSALSRPGRMATFATQTVRQGVTAATRLLPGADLQRWPAMPYQAPRTAINGEFTSRRQLVRAQVELDRVREVKSHFDVKVNDIVLAMVAGGLRGYLREVDALPRQPLVVQCPVSLRTDDSRGEVGSKVGSLFVSLATDIDDPVDRLRKITESTGAAKDMHERMARHQRLGVTEILSPAFIGIAARLYTSMHLDRTPPPVNLVVSNVPGPQFTLYVAGAPLVGMYPMGPLLLGMGLNVTAFSHGGHIDIGLFTCPDLVQSPELIASHMLDSLHELEAAR